MLHFRFVSKLILVSLALSSVSAFAVQNTDRYIVKFKKGYATKMALFGLMDQAGVGVEKTIPEIGAYIVRQTRPTLDYTILQTFYDSGAVEWIEKDDIHWFAEGVAPSDPMYKDQYHLKNIGAEAAWATTTGSDTVVVAVSDTGVQLSHPDLKNQLWTNPGEIPNNKLDDDGNGYVDDVHGWDFVKNDNDPSDDNGHGTHVAGTIGAEANNGFGGTGVSWKVRIMPVRFLDEKGAGSNSAGAESIIYAAKNGARVINASWGSYSASKAVEEAVRYATERGVVLVAAAGNDSRNTDQHPHYPSSYAPVAVAATDWDHGLAGFSNFGATHVDVSAPGVKVLATYPGDRHERLSGTSMATPVVAGVAALALAVAPNLSGLELRNLLFHSVEKVKFPGKLASEGEISAAKAVANAASTEFQLWPGVIRIATTDKFQFTAWGAAAASLQWAVSDATVAQISETGQLTPLKGGQVKVTVRNIAGGEASSMVTIVETKPATGCGAMPANDPRLPGQRTAANAFNLGVPLLVGFLLRWRRKKTA